MDQCSWQEVELNQTERVNGWTVDDAVNFQSFVLLISADRLTSCRTQRTADPAVVITKFLKRALDIYDDLVGKQISVSENGAVVIVGLVIRIVAPSREPVARIEIIISAANQNEGREVVIPPKTGVPRMLISANRVRVGTNVGWFSR